VDCSVFGVDRSFSRYALYDVDDNYACFIGPWFTLVDHDREAELLADLTGVIRADRNFWTGFNPYVNMLRTKYGICERGDDGFFSFLEVARTAPPKVIVEEASALWNQLENEGYTDRAIEALCCTGDRAWKNPVGDIAVIPPEGPLSKI